MTDSNSATITTTTTNYTGYNLYLSSTDNKMTLIGGTSSDVIESITSSTAPTSDAFENRWGYKIDSAVSYNPIPITQDEIASSSSAAPSGDIKTLTLAARAGKTKAQGAYIGNLTVTAIANANKIYSITYNKNTSTTVADMPTNVTQATTINSTINISNSSTPTRAGYEFVEWCTTSVADDATCIGTAYDPGDPITLDPATSNSINLYAVWKRPSYSVTYVLNGGTAGSSAPTTVAMDTWVQISNPTKSGATFQGWTISGMDDGTEHYYGSNTSSETYTTDTTLYTNVTYFKDLNALSGAVTFTAVWQDNYTYSWSKTTTTYTTSQASSLTTLYPSVKTSATTSQYGYYASSLGINTSGYAALSSYSSRSITYNNYTYLSSFSGKYTCCSNTQSPTNTNSKCYSTVASTSNSCYFIPTFTVSTSNRGTSSSYYYTKITGYKITTTAGTPSTTTLTSSSPTAYSFYSNTASGLTITKTILNTGAPARQTFTGITSSSKNVTLSATVPTRQNYTFLGWSTFQTAASGYLSPSAAYTTSSAKNTLYAMWGTNYSITYNANGGTGAPATQSGNAAVVTISATEPTLSGKYFHGWASSNSATEVEFKAGKAYAVSNFVPSKTLYAVWKDEPATLFMQNVDSWGDSLAVGESVQAVDARDDKTYWVTRLKTSADGSTSEIWMTQNLDFVISTSGTALTTADSNVAANKTITATNNWDFEDISFYEGEDYYLPSGTGSATPTAGLDADSTNWHYHVGNYYN